MLINFKSLKKYLMSCMFLLITAVSSASNIFNNVGGSYFDNAGQLSPLNPATVTVDDNFPGNMAITPNGRYAYVIIGNFWVAQFIIGIDGQLSRLTPFNIPTGGYLPYDIKITSNGKYAYISNSGVSSEPPYINTISQYSIGADGQLNPLSPPTESALAFIEKIAITPDNKFLYSVSTRNDYVGQSSIGTDGQLHDLNPYAVKTNFNGQDIVITPNGKFVYITNGAGTISQYSIATNGQLIPLNPSLVASCAAPTEMVITPNGKFLYVIPGYPGDNLVQYSINTNGQLTPLNPSTVSGVIGATRIIVSPNGKFIYVTIDGSSWEKGSVAQFSVSADGQLTRLEPFMVDTVAGPNGVAITPDSQFEYITGIIKGDNSISQYRVKVSK